jgi:hypothetical protein
MELTEYNRDQLEALLMVHRHLRGLSTAAATKLKRMIQPYLRFRAEVRAFQERHLSGVCTEKCFTDQSSACCGREGIATFFADVMINVLLSSREEIDLLFSVLSGDRGGFKCVYLTAKGCLWHLKPVVCEMFLCDHAKETLRGRDEDLFRRWEALRVQEKQYTWPDRPVLFDQLEEAFMKAGLDSPLMYFHRSPGLLRVKAQAVKDASRRPESRD